MNTERRRGKHSGRNGQKPTSNYYGVSFDPSGLWQFSATPWRARIKQGWLSLSRVFPTEREAAIQVDKWVLQYRLNAPLNILKPKA